jgi:glycosyltransferase involved in cell wall biosynthesis
LPAGVKSKATVIPHPVFEHYRVGLTSPIPARLQVVFFGRLEPYKGLHNFCEAAAQLSAEGVDADFIIAGSGRLSDCLHGASPACVNVVNKLLSEQEVGRLLASATVVVLPYTDATQSGVLAAAYALGVPVVATRVGSFPEYVKDGVSGLLVPPNDSIALAGAIRRILLEPELRKTMSNGADGLACTTFSWSEVLSRHLALYADLVSSCRHEPRLGTPTLSADLSHGRPCCTPDEIHVSRLPIG